MAGATLDDWLDHLLLCVQRHIARYGHRMVQASGNLNQLYVGLEEARRVLRGGTPAIAPAAAGALALPNAETLDARIAESRTRLRTSGGWVAALQQRFQLGFDELELLMAASAPMLSVDLSRLYTFAWADFAVKLPSVGFLVELLADTPAQRANLVRFFLPAAPLVRSRLVELRAATAWGDPTPLLHQGVVMPDSVASFLRGHADPGVASPDGTTQSYLPADGLPAEQLYLAPNVFSSLQSVLTQGLVANGPRLNLLGPKGSGRRTALGTAAAAHGLGVLVVDLVRLAADEKTFPARLGAALRDGLLRGSVPLLRGDLLFDDREKWEPLARRTGELVGAHPGPVAFSAREPNSVLEQNVRHLYDLRFPVPGTPEQRKLWISALNVENAGEMAAALSQRFKVTPGTLHVAVTDARSRHRFTGGDGPVQVHQVADAVRRRLDHALSNVAQPYTTTLDWDDVVLPEDVMNTLNEILSQARYREKVFDEWGMRRKMSYGRGLACLFAGPPGTGKTMMAGIMAKTLGRELYKVDISKVVSKWVGETEKNLGRIFDEAERAQVILLFDEADSLFSTRTEVKGSNDRFANMEINYLLQRMESYDGMSLLTTNFEKSIDEAFKRRLKFKVDFPLPEPEERATLWRVMMPDPKVVAGDIDYERLGKKFRMSGGNIKNAVLRAAFYAAEEGTIIDHALLLRAAIAESRDMGRLI